MRKSDDTVQSTTTVSRLLLARSMRFLRVRYLLPPSTSFTRSFPSASSSRACSGSFSSGVAGCAEGGIRVTFMAEAKLLAESANVDAANNRAHSASIAFARRMHRLLRLRQIRRQRFEQYALALAHDSKCQKTSRESRQIQSGIDISEVAYLITHTAAATVPVFCIGIETSVEKHGFWLSSYQS